MPLSESLATRISPGDVEPVERRFLLELVDARLRLFLGLADRGQLAFEFLDPRFERFDRRGSLRLGARNERGGCRPWRRGAGRVHDLRLQRGHLLFELAQLNAERCLGRTGLHGLLRLLRAGRATVNARAAAATSTMRFMKLTYLMPHVSG